MVKINRSKPVLGSLVLILFMSIVGGYVVSPLAERSYSEKYLNERQSELKKRIETSIAENGIADNCELVCEYGEISSKLNDTEELSFAIDALSKFSDLDLRVSSSLLKLESDLFKLKGLYRLSLDAFQKHKELSDSLLKINAQERLTHTVEDLKTQYASFGRSQSNSNETYIRVLIFLFVLSIVVALYTIYSKRKLEDINVQLTSLLAEQMQFKATTKPALVHKSKDKLPVQTSETIVPGLTNDIVNKILDGLKNFEDNKGYTKNECSINDVADALNTNKTYLSKVVNVVKGKPFNIYINELRLDYSIKLLKDESYRKYTIKAIAHESGFRSKSTFNSAFKEYVGRTPSEFMRSTN